MGDLQGDRQGAFKWTFNAGPSRGTYTGTDHRTNERASEDNRRPTIGANKSTDEVFVHFDYWRIPSLATLAANTGATSPETNLATGLLQILEF